MLVQWVMDGGDVHDAEQATNVQGGVVTLRLRVENLGEAGWNWHVWDHPGRGQQQYGLTDTLAEAKAKAESALDAIALTLAGPSGG